MSVTPSHQTPQSEYALATSSAASLEMGSQSAGAMRIPPLRRRPPQPSRQSRRQSAWLPRHRPILRQKTITLRIDLPSRNAAKSFIDPIEADALRNQFVEHQIAIQVSIGPASENLAPAAHCRNSIAGCAFPASANPSGTATSFSTSILPSQTTSPPGRTASNVNRKAGALPAASITQSTPRPAVSFLLDRDGVLVARIDPGSRAHFAGELRVLRRRYRRQ